MTELTTEPQLDTPQTDDLPRTTTELLYAVRDLLSTYIVFTSPAQALAVALFTLNTHVFDAWTITPYLVVTSAEKRSGKSRLLEVLSMVVANPWFQVSPTAAVLFRKIEKEQPTLLLDEADTLSNEQRGAIRDVLNAGFQAAGVVSRCKKDTFEVEEFRVFSPKVLCGIGTFLSDTTLDRSIIVKLRRKLADDGISRYRSLQVENETKGLREALIVWGRNAKAVLSEATPDLPDELHDRAQDIWEPLFAVADLAGDAIGQQARQVALELSASGDEMMSEPAMLLFHIREVFRTNKTVQDGRITSADLVHALVADETWPWSMVFPTLRDEHYILRAQRQLTAMLGPFDIGPKLLRFRDDTGRSTPTRGYEVSMFEDAWRRHLPPIADDGSPTVTTATSVTPQLRAVTDAVTDAVADVQVSDQRRNGVTDVTDVLGTGGDENVRTTETTLADITSSLPVRVFCKNGHGMTCIPEQIAGSRCQHCGEPFTVVGEMAAA